MESNEYAGHDALGLAELIASGQVSAAEVVEAARSRARDVNPEVNAIVRWMDDEADARLREPLDGPFAGVPFLLKDLGQEYAGLPSSFGCRALANVPAVEHATIVRRWLDAGLVVLGKTNTPEFGAKAVTESALFGPARNPWDRDRTPGARRAVPPRPSPPGSFRSRGRATAAARSASRPPAAACSGSRPGVG